MEIRRRSRDLGWLIGNLPPGPLNSITDIPGVQVGHTTLVTGEGPLVPGQGPVRTGVTVILPHGGNIFREKVPAAVYTINGFGKAFGFEQVRELGNLESPIALTNTLNVGLVADALVQVVLQANPDIGVFTGSVNVVVGETNDAMLNDLQGRHVRYEHVLAALAAASSGPVSEGAVGAGTGTICFGWKGGIGTASRVTPAAAGGFSLGVLVQTNFGAPEDLTVLGVPVGQFLTPRQVVEQTPHDAGSIMIILATDAPLNSRQLSRLAQRSAAGIARCGGFYGHSSGDFALAFSTAYTLPHKTSEFVAALPAVIDEAAVMAGLFPAVVECVEEAILNSLCMAHTVTGRDGITAYALPLERTTALLRRFGRLSENKPHQAVEDI
jgi:D-aminopeptidase